MRYENVKQATFIHRPNRFIAKVDLDGQILDVHVKNTGRCREILIPGSTVFIQKSGDPDRKTSHSLISVRKGKRLINIDSQAPNQVVFEALCAGSLQLADDISTWRKEVSYGSSRFDFYGENATVRAYIEVKGVTLEEDDMTLFPDAPTLRGTRHVHEMIRAVREGHAGYLIFVVQMKGVRCFSPNERTDPAFTQALRSAARQNVHILCYDCHVTPDSLRLSEPVPVIL